MDFSSVLSSLNTTWLTRRGSFSDGEIAHLAYQDTFRHKMLGFMTRVYYQRKKLIQQSEIFYAYVFQEYNYDENQRQNGGATWLVFSPSKEVNDHPEILKKIAANLQQLKVKEPINGEEKALKKLLVEPLSETSYCELIPTMSDNEYAFLSIVDLHKELLPSFHLGLNLVLANKSVSKEVLYLPEAYFSQEWKEAYLKGEIIL
jgi:hypothetical protein